MAMARRGIPPLASLARCRPRPACLAVAQAGPLGKPARRSEAAPRRVRATGTDGEAVPLPASSPPPLQPDAVVAQAGHAAGVADALLDRVVRAPYKAYVRALDAHPLTTKACTSFVGFMLGDAIAQHMSHPGVPLDVVRVLRLGAYGLLVDGPVGSTWYDLLERSVYPEQPTGAKAVLAKTALDQLVYATVMTGVYFTLIKTWEGHPELVLSTLQAKFWPTLAANYAIWPLAHLVNFRFVPSQFRILYNNVVCVAWLTYLSLLTHTKISLFSFLPH